MLENITVEMLAGWGGCTISCLILKKVFFKEKTWIDVLVIMFFSMFIILMSVISIGQIAKLHWFLYVIIGLGYPPFIKSFFDQLDKKR